MKYFTIFCFVSLLTYSVPFNYLVTEVCAGDKSDLKEVKQAKDKRASQPEVTVKCDEDDVEDRIVYENKSGGEEKIRFWAIDNCDGQDSHLDSFDKNGNPLRSIEIRDGKGKFGTMFVPDGGGIEFFCEGNGKKGCTFIWSVFKCE